MKERGYMKIIFLLPDMAGGGSEKVVSLLANEYVGRGINVAIMMFAGNTVAYALDERVEVLSVAPASAGNMCVRLGRVRRMRAFFKKNTGAYIFSFSTMGTAFATMATWGMRRFILVSERNDPNYCPNAAWRDWAYKKADCLTFLTAEIRDYFPPNIREKGVVIPNPIDDTLPRRKNNPREKTVVAVGRLETQKNYPLLLAAFKAFCAEYPEYDLHIYGTGSLEAELKEMAGTLGIADGVVWHGFDPDVQEKIINSGMYVLSSDFEGISNAMIEALAMGIPTIATDSLGGGSRSYIKNGENGLLVPVRDAEALAGAMKRIAADEALAKKLSDNAMKIRDKYSVSEIADRFLECVEELT